VVEGCSGVKTPDGGCDRLRSEHPRPAARLAATGLA
jgi:hypothetical protein